jgi:hypothetical protein
MAALRRGALAGTTGLLALVLARFAGPARSRAAGRGRRRTGVDRAGLTRGTPHARGVVSRRRARTASGRHGRPRCGQHRRAAERDANASQTPRRAGHAPTSSAVHSEVKEVVVRHIACLRAAVVVALGLTASPVFAQHAVADVMAWPECGQYFSPSPCKVVVNLSDQDEGGHRSRVVGDVTLRPGQDAAVLLIHGSPLIACTVGATAAGLTRDVAGSFEGGCAGAVRQLAGIVQRRQRVLDCVRHDERRPPDLSDDAAPDGCTG